MSETVRGFGFIAVLINPITDSEKRECICNALWSNCGALDINYEGTLVIFDANHNESLDKRSDIYHFTIGLPEVTRQEFLKHCVVQGLEIDLTTVLPWQGIWYTGSDSPQSQLTLAEFKQRLIK